jgi:hypothetical protein
MNHAPPPYDDGVDMSGFLLSESKHELLRDLCDELQLLVTLIATTYPIDDEVLPMELKRAAVARYLRGVAERIETALEERN